MPIEQTELLLVGNLQKDLAQVLKKIKVLPSVKFFGSTDKQTLKKLYQDRHPLYKKYSDISVIKNSYNEIETFDRIEAKINEYFNS